MASDSPSPTASLPLLHDFDSPSSHSLDSSADKRRDLEHGDNDGFDDVELRPRRPTRSWSRFLMALSRRRTAPGTQRLHLNKLEREALNLPDAKERAHRRWKKRYAGWLCLVIPLLVVFFFGVVHITNVLMGYVPIFQDDKLHRFIPPGRYQPGENNPELEAYYLDVTRDVTPIPCHSHNDYWRRVPLYDALSWGCTGVEADVWLFNNEQGDNELFVGHNTNALIQDHTFRSMYVDPITRMLDHKNQPGKYGSDSNSASINGVFDVDPTRTLVLLVDFKNDGHDIFPVVSEQLNALREKGYLSYFDGETTITRPVTVVATGNAPFDLITANATYRDIFFDSPLERMFEEPVKTHNQAKKRDQGQVGTDPDSEFDTTNSFYASLSFNSNIGWVWFGRFSEAQLTKVRGQIQGAHQRGLKVRYWDTPKWPISLRNKVWEVLVEEGVDYINGDDLEAMADLNWDKRGHSGWLG